MHISERGPFFNQRRIQTSPFNPRGHERSSKSAPQHTPAVSSHYCCIYTREYNNQLIISGF